jgi:hypothetical protein
MPEGAQFHRWVGNRLSLEKTFWLDWNRNHTPLMVFDLAAGGSAQVDEETPPARNFSTTGVLVESTTGPAWLAEITRGSYEMTFLDQCYFRCNTNLGTGFEIPSGVHERIRFLDPKSGRVLHEVPAQLHGTCVISPDARLIACLHPNEALHMWDAYPSARWPWATAGGLLAAAFMFLLTQFIGSSHILGPRRRAKL